MNGCREILLNAKLEGHRILRGKLRGSREFVRVTILLWSIAALFFAICWHLHPPSCTVSIFDDTISHFGKPDEHGDSLGFLAFHLGFASLCLYMLIAVEFRGRQLSALPGEKTARATQLYVAGILGLTLSLIFPESKSMQFAGIGLRKLHGVVVVVGIFCFAGGILHDTKKLWDLYRSKRENQLPNSGNLPKKLLPILLLAGIFGTGLTFMGIWEVRCYFDTTLDKWPGEGIFSTALWEWIVFTYLIIFMFWYTYSLSSVVMSRGGMSTLRRWQVE